MQAGRVEPSAATVDRFAAAVSKGHVTVDEGVTLSRELARRLRSLGGAPVSVVAVANGGVLPGRVVADELGLPLFVVTVRRGGSRWKERLARLAGMRRLAIAWQRSPVLGRLLRAAIHAADALLPWSVSAEGLPPLEGTVLLVDDAIQTGATARRAHELVRRAGATRVLTGVLTCSPPSGEVLEPDVCWIGRRLQRFPWSGDSPHRAEWLAWLAAHDAGLST